MTEAPPTPTPPRFETVPHSGERLAYLAVEGRDEGPTLVWLGGFRSDMRGTKAEVLSALCEREGLPFLRFDYSGHGGSEGRFEDGTISGWTEDAAAMIAARTRGPLLLVGSSMGAWIALRLAQRLPGRVRCLLLLAPAPDFTTRLVEPRLTAQDRAALARDGFIAEPSPYSDQPTVYTRRLIEDGAAAAVMTGPIALDLPVHVIQGMEDPDVPHAHALELVSLLPSAGVTLTLVKDGDHRLSRPEDLQRMERAVLALLGEGAASA
ncbi:alpha/beta hydrolase [Aureimonas flava]|uniref:Palmitoyl-protein thioesterase ABHD10, mitochondrial n=1 Tax=Aureimonas flava TaxID=2320271 RepID=A0A3A1WPE4_9HYPH|nr:alpha/beta hydrolase [Aureimonas flava]RIX99181.1 alpha/beta hydrolase [Aureimonas flava]